MTNRSRIGLVFVVNKDEVVDGSKDVGVALLRAFNYIAKRDSAVKALSFLTDVSISIKCVTCSVLRG
jgi:UDP-glucose:glycoprotein glucosyltransferase